MQPIEPDNHVHDAVAVVVVHVEKMHGGIFHPQQGVDVGCVSGWQEIAMRRSLRGKVGRAQVKQVALMIVFHVREESYKSAQPHHKHQMEIGKLPFAAVEPLQAVGHKLIERRIHLLVARSIIDELSQEEQYAQFRGIKGNRSVWNADTCIADVVKLLIRTDVKLHLQDSQRLEELLLQFSFLRLWNAHHTRHPSFLFRQEVHNEFILPVFNRAEHHGLSLQQHVGKYTNIFSNCQIIPPHNETFWLQYIFNLQMNTRL